MNDERNNARLESQSSASGDEPSAIRFRRALHAFAVLFVIATFGLIVLGGTVTSKGMGMAVPDWPTTYHYNMFLFPPSMWQGGVFWEHTHRLAGSVVGMMAIVMAVWLTMTQSRARGGQPWLRWLGWATLAMVIAQGVMGGLRVTEIDYRWGIVHGVTAQVYLCMTVLIAAATGRWWMQARRAAARNRRDESVDRNRAIAANNPRRGPLPGGAGVGVALRRLSLAVLAVLLVQLGLGAAMRHMGAGLAIPDFPSSYGRVIPPLSQDAIDKAYTAAVPWDAAPSTASPAAPAALHYPTAAQVGVHFAHRAWALVVVAMVLWLVTRVAKVASADRAFVRPAAALGLLLVMQVALGALVIWTGRHPEMATAHQATGAATLATAALLSFRLFAARPAAPTPVPQPARPAPAALAMEGAGA